MQYPACGPLTRDNTPLNWSVHMWSDCTRQENSTKENKIVQWSILSERMVTSDYTFQGHDVALSRPHQEGLCFGNVLVFSLLRGFFNSSTSPTYSHPWRTQLLKTWKIQIISNCKMSNASLFVCLCMCRIWVRDVAHLALNYAGKDQFTDSTQVHQ